MCVCCGVQLYVMGGVGTLMYGCESCNECLQLQKIIKLVKEHHSYLVPVVIVIKSWRYGVLDNFTQIERNTLIWLSIEFIHQHFSYLLIHVELFFSLNYYFTTCLSSAQGIRSSCFSVMVINMTF